MSHTLPRLQIVAVNRLVLDLSLAIGAQEDSDFFSRTGLDPPIFAMSSIIGNIGGPMRTASEADCGDEEFTAEGGIL